MNERDSESSTIEEVFKETWSASFEIWDLRSKEVFHHLPLEKNFTVHITKSFLCLFLMRNHCFKLARVINYFKILLKKKNKK